MSMVGIMVCPNCGRGMFDDADRCYECGAEHGQESRFLLEVCHATGRFEKIVSPGDEITVGRSSDNDVVIGDPRVSRHHLHLRFSVDGAWVQQLGSTNPSFIAGRSVGTGASLAPGSSLELSGATITLAHQG